MSLVLALHDRKGILVIYLHNTRKLDIMYLSIQMTFINMYGNEKKFFVHFLFECMHPVFFLDGQHIRLMFECCSLGGSH